jgi:DNA invertase Pin-like site-specific DNA recombinase
VSTAEQANEGASLAAQEAKVRAYAALYDLELVAIEVDAGVSAKSLRRPALQRALGALKRGAADALVVVKLDRLTRSVRDLADLLDLFSDGKRSLLSVSEQIDTRSASGRLVLNLLTSVAAWEREACGERVAAVKEHQASQGRYLGGVTPYGYTVDSEGTLVHDEGEQAVISAARDLRARGLALRAIAATLTERRIVARNGRPFASEQVRRMLASSSEASNVVEVAA